MWARYDGAVVRDRARRSSPSTAATSRARFCFWPDFVPEPEQLDDDVLARFGDFLDAHVELGLSTIPTFIVGHMSGENWDPAWREGRDLYRDPWLVSQQAWFAAEIARAFGEHPAIVGWLLSNEMPLYGGPATSDEIAAWARALVHAVRATGATQPISHRRRRVGSRDVRKRQRLLAARARAARRLRRAARVSDAGRPGAAAARRRVRVRARGQLRQARHPRGVRRQLRLRVGRERRRLLPAGPLHLAACGRPRLDRLEQLRLRRPPARGSVPPPRRSRCTSA